MLIETLIWASAQFEAVVLVSEPESGKPQARVTECVGLGAGPGVSPKRPEPSGWPDSGTVAPPGIMP